MFSADVIQIFVTITKIIDYRTSIKENFHILKEGLKIKREKLKDYCLTSSRLAMGHSILA